MSHGTSETVSDGAQVWGGVATVSSIDKIIGLFCERDL